MFILAHFSLNSNYKFLVMSYKDFDLNFQRLCKLGEGSYGQVFLCSPKENYSPTNETISVKQNNHHNSNQNTTIINEKSTTSIPKFYALKKLKMRVNKPYSYYEEEKEPNVEDLRQVQIMKLLHHQNLIPFNEILMQDKGYKKNFYLTLPFGVQILQFAKQKHVLLTKALRKTILHQIINGLQEIHSHKILHRDLKPDNIFLMKNGTIKIGDFSLSREKPHFNSSSAMIQQDQEPVKLTGNVTTRYYRAPQIMYGSRHYDQKIDIWSLGCTIAQLILHQPLFPGQTDINQLEFIFRTVGYPQQHWPKAGELPFYLEFTKNEEEEKQLSNVLPDIEPELLDLIESCLQLDPERRATASQLLSHQYFKNVEAKSVELEKIAIYLHEKKIKELFSKKG